MSIAAGMVAVLRSRLDFAFRVPGIAYWATVLGGLAASLAIIVSTFPLLNRIAVLEVEPNG